MKKFFITLIVMFSCLLSAGIILKIEPVDKAFAEDTNVSSVSLTPYKGNQLLSNVELDFATLQNPYDKITLVSTISCSPDFNILSAIAQQNIISTLTWWEGSTQIIFNDSMYTSVDNSYKLELLSNQKDVYFTPLKPNTTGYSIQLKYGSIQSAPVLIKTNYALPKTLSITTLDETTIDYDSFSNITLSVNTQELDYLNPSANLTFKWYINNILVANNTSNTLILNKTLLPFVDSYTIKAVSDQSNSFAEKIINITTLNGYILTVSHSGGALEQILTSNSISPIQFSAFTPYSEEYIVSWFLKKPNSNLYTKLSSTSNNLTFNPADYKSGNYKLYAETIIAGKKIISTTFEIILSKPPVEVRELQFTITATKTINTKTPSVEAYVCKIDADETYADDRFIWYVDGYKFAIGKQFTYEPNINNNHTVSVKILNDDNTISTTPIAPSISLNVKLAQTVSYPLLFSLIGAGIIIIGIGLIFLGNKLREKIW